MLTYSFTNLKNESLYMHLYQCIRQDIVDGKLVSGEKLPSKRSFAKNLGVSTITIENAYAQLLSEGYIYSIPKKGFYVSDFKNNAVIATILIFSRRFKPTRTHTSSNTPMMAHHTPAPAEKIPFAAKAPS